MQAVNEFPHSAVRAADRRGVAVVAIIAAAPYAAIAVFQVALAALDDDVMRHRRVAIVVFDGVQGLDVFGPADVFYFANYFAETAGEETLPYAVEIAGPVVGPVRTAAGPRLYVERAITDPDLRPDVVLVAGGLTVDAAAGDEQFVADLRDLAARSGEVGSVCTGALLLAETGLLDWRRATDGVHRRSPRCRPHERSPRRARDHGRASLPAAVHQ